MTREKSARCANTRRHTSAWSSRSAKRARRASKEARDARIESGMEVGMQEGMDLLERVAISLR